MKCIDPSHSQEQVGTLHFIGFFSHRTENNTKIRQNGTSIVLVDLSSYKMERLYLFNTCNLNCLFLETNNQVTEEGMGTPFCKICWCKTRKRARMFQKILKEHSSCYVTLFLMKWSVPTFDSIYRPFLIFLHFHSISLLFLYVFFVFRFLRFSSLFCIAKWMLWNALIQVTHKKSLEHSIL